VELTVLAWRRREADARRLAGELLRDFAGRGSGIGVRLTHHALAVLELGLGNHQQALRQMLAATVDQPVLSLQSEAGLLVESAIGCGDRHAATAALKAVGPRAVASGSHRTSASAPIAAANVTTGDVSCAGAARWDALRANLQAVRTARPNVVSRPQKGGKNDR
jgi:hypothetical protein